MKIHRHAAAAVALIILGGVFCAAAASPSRFYRVFTAEAQGFVFYSDGLTPAVEVPVRIWDLDQRKFVYETFTDEFGAFQLPKLGPGQYFVTFDTLKLDLAVADLIGPVAQQPHDIIVILPRVTAAMPLMQLNAVLLASTISEGAYLYRNEDRQIIVSP